MRFWVFTALKILTVIFVIWDENNASIFRVLNSKYVLQNIGNHLPHFIMLYHSAFSANGINYFTVAKTIKSCRSNSEAIHHDKMI